MSKIVNWTKNWANNKKIPFHFLPQTTSSNTVAKQKAFKGHTCPFVFLTEKQTHGRGTNNKTWKNSDLMLSVLWDKNVKKIKPSHCKYFMQDVYQSLTKTWPKLKMKIHPPNDLYLFDKKLAGLLLEVLTQGQSTALVIGLGLNVFSCPKNLPASCLAQQTDDINQKTWHAFLSHLFVFWSKRVAHATKLTLVHSHLVS